MKVLIIEDEKPAADKLIQMLRKADSSIQVMNVLESVESSINWLVSNSHPDLLFMDIQLDDGISFEIFENVKIDAPVIFVTAYDEYAIKAFKVNSIDYLLKPYNLDDLNNALKKYSKLHQEKKIDSDILESILQKFSKKYKSRFFIKVGEHFKTIETNNVECFFVQDKCPFLKTNQNKMYALDQSLEQLETVLTPDLFFRINRNYIVNIQNIINVTQYSSSRLKIELTNTDNESLVVSRQKVNNFKKWMNNE